MEKNRMKKGVIVNSVRVDPDIFTGKWIVNVEDRCGRWYEVIKYDIKNAAVRHAMEIDDLGYTEIGL